MRVDESTALTMTTIAELDRRVRARHLLRHPFYQAWSAGTMPLDTLRAYGHEYYAFERNFPRFVAGAYARLQDPRDRRVLLENLIDEEGRSPTHPELWQRFVHAIRGSTDVRDPVRPSTRRLLRTYESLTVKGSPLSALGALYAYESQFPEVAREKSRGLAEQYGIRSRAAHEFFRVHSEADVRHSAWERRILRSELARSGARPEEAVRGVDRALDAWWGFLDSFC